MHSDDIDGAQSLDEGPQPVEYAMEPIRTNEIPGLGDLSQILGAAYAGQLQQFDHVARPEEVPPSTWDDPEPIPALGPIDPFSTDGWTAYASLDDTLLQGWPFVLDSGDLGCATRTENARIDRPPVADLQQLWHTHLESDQSQQSGYTTPLPTDDQDVDDNYRQSLHRRLQIRIHAETTLPSADYLNLCVRSYFKRFNPIFPILHPGTFKPTKTNAVLILSICSIGSLLTGHPAALSRGILLFERLNKATLSNFEAVMRRGPEHSFAMTQASLLGQTFGLLSGRPGHLAIVEAFHGTIVAWARRDKAFQHHDAIFGSQKTLDQNWREWAQQEERRRLALAVHIHDAEIANTLHSEPFLNSASRRPPLPDDDAMFFAPTAREWWEKYTKRQQTIATPASELSTRSMSTDAVYERLLSLPRQCHFATCSTLEDILSAVLQARAADTLTEPFVNDLHRTLATFYDNYALPSTISTPNPSGLQQGNTILYHLIFLNSLADMNLLEHSIGRDGATVEQAALHRVHAWAESPDAPRAAAHAIMIKRALDSFPLSAEPPVHVPRALLYGALCLVCYIRYRGGGDGAGLERRRGVEAPELQVMGVSVESLLRGLDEPRKKGNGEMSAVYGFVDLLRRIGHWDISRMFAAILVALIHAECG